MESNSRNSEPTVAGTGTRWLCAYRLFFKDGGNSESEVIHLGSKESCEAMLKNPAICAVAYTGNRPVDRAELFIAPAQN